MFRKSSFCDTADCIEVDSYRKSKYSISNGACVEVGNGIAVRDSVNPDGLFLEFQPQAWREFIASLR